MYFKIAQTETFLFDTGATVSMIGLIIAQANDLTINKIDTPRNIVEASGTQLDIVGSCTIYVKLEVLGKTKRLKCLVLKF